MKYKSILIFCAVIFTIGKSQAQDDSVNVIKKQAFTELQYSKFSLVINNFNPYSFINSVQDLPNFGGDTSVIVPMIIPNLDETPHLILKVKMDSVNLEETINNYINDNLIKVVSKNKSDIFKVSFSYNYRVYEPYDSKSGRKYDEWEKNKIGFSGATKYQQIKDSAKCFYRVPQYKYNYYENQLKKKMNLQDTLVRVVNEFAEECTLIYKSKPCVYKMDNICIRIERYVGNKLKEVKYILIWYDYYG